jgi:hypothetical protein
MFTEFKSLLCICLIGMFTFGSASSYAITSGCPDTGAYPMNGCSLPGTVDGSFPYFYQNVSVSYKQKKKTEDFQVKAKLLKGSTNSALYVDSEDVLDITKTNFKFDAKVTGGVASGNIKISGRIDELGIKGTLMTADLEGAWDANGTLIGFNTMNIQCNDGINAYLGGGGCTTNEVIYLNLLQAIGPDAGARKISTAGIAVTSVPVPAAAWLFGSGLLGLITMARRRGHRIQG